MNYLQRKKRAFMSIVNSIKGFVRRISGIPPITLVDCVDDKSVINYQIYGNSEQLIGILPSEYQQVEYIEATGTQYIDTKYIPNTNTRIKCQYLLRKNDGMIFGSRSSGSSNDSFYTYTYTNQLYCGYGGQNDVVTKDTTLNTINILEISKDGAYFNDTKIKTFSEVDFNGSYSMYLFALNQGGTLDSRLLEGAVYSFEIYEGDLLVKNLIPCYRKIDGEIGMYDMVTDTFHTNKGTGVFLKGDSVTGEPSPDNPIEVISVGEYDSETGKYKIPVIAKGGNGEVATTNIYLDEPLRKIGDYADYIDFTEGKLVRNINYISEFEANSNFAFTKNTTNSLLRVVNIGAKKNKDWLYSGRFLKSNVFGAMSDNCGNTWSKEESIYKLGLNNTGEIWIGIGQEADTKESAIAWINSLPQPIIYYVLDTPTEETIDLSNLPTFKGTTIYTIGTTVQPSNMVVDYYSTTKGE